MSTLRTKHPKLTAKYPHTVEGYSTASKQNQLTYITGRVISYIWGLIYQQPFQDQFGSLTPKGASLKVDGDDMGLQKPTQYVIRLEGEPPDIPDIGSHKFPPNHSPHAFNSIVQHEMNERLIPSKPPLEKGEPTSVSAGGETIFWGRKWPTGSSFRQLLASFDGPAHGTMAWKGIFASLSIMMLWLSAFAAKAQTTTINLSLHEAISSQSPAIGNAVTYTVVVANAPGSTTATNVTVTNTLPAGGVAYIPGSASIVHGVASFSATGSTTATVGLLTIPAIAPGDSAVLVLQATVLQRGVWFNTAEVTAADQTDVNSVPNDHILTQDDYDAVCFSVPILWYPGDEYTVTIPSGYDQIVWYKDGAPISSTAISTSLVEVNSDMSLTIKSPGTYRFVTYRNGCPATSCCDIQVDQGPYGSLGDYVWNDLNHDGKQDSGEPGIDGVKVYLYDQTGTVKLDSTVTAGGGKYLFDNLTDGSYVVRFTTPAGFTSTIANAAGVTDDLNSDAGTNGFTKVYTIDTSQPTSSTARNNPTVDAGFYLPSAGLGDFVWNDLNHDGIQGPGEPGIPGVTVTLYLNGIVSQTALTDASGFYSFTGLTPGSSNSYVVGFTAPAGFTASTPYSGTDRTKDSNADLATGKTESVTLAPGEFNPTLDAGFYIPSAGLGDFVWNDLNHDGIQDSGEPGIAGVTVTLYQNGVVSQTALTNSSGFYSFTGLTPGSSNSYVVGFTAPAGFTASTPYSGTDRTKDSNADLATGKTESVTLAPGEFNPTLDAGFYIPSAGLGDFVWNDLNHDGIQDSGEPGIAGVTVTLYQNGVVSQTALTNSSGFYSFTGLTPGSSNSYVVGFTAPAGFTASTPYSGTDRTKDSNADLATGKTESVTLAPGEFNPTLDAGFYIPSAGLGDFVWNDLNHDGIQDSGEPGIPGVTVTLYVNGVASATTVTNSSGFYSFTGLTPGSSTSYVVGFTAPAGFTASTPYSGTDRTKDSNADLATGKTESVTLAPGEFNSTLDGGFYIPSAGLGDFVWNDLNHNGIQDSGEPGIPGVTVTLYVNGVASATTVTNSSGFYSFTGLTPGSSNSYVVGFTAPAGFTASTPYSGTDRTKDSNADLATGKTESVTLAPGEFNPTLDAGFYIPSAGLGDFVWNDLNHDGIQDSGEPGIAGVTVTLYVNGVASATTVTNSSGFYSFTGLTPGSSNSYVVGFTAPTGYTATSQYSGTDRTKDSNADLATGKTESVTLAPGEFNPTLDAGFFTCPANLAPVVSNDKNICNGDVVALSATSPVSDAQIHWYLTPYDGVAFATTSNGMSLTVNPTTTTVYYAEAFTSAGCVSARKPVVVQVTTVPTPICLGVAYNTCPSTTVDLTQIEISNQSTSLTYEWYTNIDRSANTRVTNLTAVGAGKYYLFAKSGDCYSSPTVLTVQIKDCSCQNPASVTALASTTAVCSGDQIALQAVLGGSATSVQWTGGINGTFSSTSSLTATYTPSDKDIEAGRVLLTVTTNDPDGTGVCTSASYSVLVKINKRPEAPTSVACDDTIVCQGRSTKLVGFAPNNTIKWYDQDGKLIGSTVSGGKLTVTPSKSGSVVYYAEAISSDGCTSASRTAITITVGQCLADLAVVKEAVTPGSYSIGQNITYSITASNNGPITGTDVKVTDVLPASLSYVSSSPSGQYDASTGVWSIGTLTAGSNRVLLVVAKIVSGGSIKNLAKIDGSNNDPKYPQNDTSSVTIPVNPCNLQPPTVLCAITEICKGGTTTLSAKGCADGTVKWSDGHTGMTIFATPSVTTTYTASCVVGSCVSAASEPITVTVLDPKAPTLTASADNVCPGASVTLTAAGCEGGIIEWSDKAQTGASIVVTPYGKTTYTAQCRQGSCLSNPAVITINVNTDLPTPTVTCSTTVVCPGETVTLTVNNCLGTPVWNSTTATTSSIVVTPTLGSNSYYVYCKNGSCVSKSSNVYTINVVAPVIPTIVASADTICAGGVVSLTATDCNGTVKWSTGQTGTTITVSPTANISYYAQCLFRSCLSDPSNTASIAVVTPSAPIVKVSKTLICSGEPISLTATGCNGTVQWQGVNLTGSVITIYPTATTEYSAICKQGSCVSASSNKVRVTVNTSAAPAPTVTASTTAICNGGLVSLTATGCDGTVKWSDGQTGNVVSVTATPSVHEFYALCMPASSSACGTGKSNVINVNVTSTPKPTIARCLCSQDTICPGEQVKFTAQNCQGTPHWSTGETTTSIVVSPTVTTSYSVYCQDGGCVSESSDAYKITVIPVVAPTITASATAVTPGSSVTLTATGCVGTVIWSANDINGNNKGTTLVVQPVGTQTYYAQCQFRSCLSDPSITIVINPGNCIAKAGTLSPISATVCGGGSSTVSVGATSNGGLVQPTGYSVVYLLASNGVIQQTSASSQFSVPSTAANYTIHTLVYDGNSSDVDYLNLSSINLGVTRVTDVIQLIGNKCASLDATGAGVAVKVVAPPTLVSASSLTVCYGSSTTLTVSGCDGGTVNWSDGSIGASITKTVYTNLTLLASCTQNGCTSGASQPISVVVANPSVPTIVGNTPMVCVGETLSLTATGCTGGSYLWSDGSTGSVITATPTQEGTLTYRVKCTIGSCAGDWSAVTSITVGKPAPPTVTILGGGTSATACYGSSVTLVAQGCSADNHVSWSNNMTGATIVVSPTSTATYTAYCCSNSNYCKSDASNEVTITVRPKVSTPVVSDKVNSCPLTTVDLTSAVSSSVTTSGGVFEYYTDAALTNKVSNPAAVGTGTYYVIERTVDGCVSDAAVVHVQINDCQNPTPCTNPATASAGSDASICASQTYALHGTMGGGAQTAHWTTSGSGSFDNPYSLSAIYTPSAEDAVSGKVTLTLTTGSNNTACALATDDLLLTINGGKTIPVITITGSTNLCYGDSVTLKAPSAPGYQWSNGGAPLGATTQNIVVKTSGVYTVQLVDATGCTSTSSAAVTVHVADPVLPPLVHNLRNTCPSKIVDLTQALSTTNVGSSYIYRICECNTSNIVIRPDSVCDGTYWIVEKTAQGCVSKPSKVVVKVFDCASDTLNTDVSMTKTVNHTVVNGTPVTYTLTVNNAGPHTAYNIDVRDVLPSGLSLVGSPVGYNYANGVITKRIDSLKVGASVQLVFSARVVTKGVDVVNKGEITYLDNNDTNLANNISSVTVRDTATAVDTATVHPSLGVALAVQGVVQQPDNSYNITYKATLKNFGTVDLSLISLVDSLNRTFASPVSYSVVSGPTVGATSTLVADPSFNGSSQPNLLASASSLAVGVQDTVVFTVNVQTNGNSGPFYSSAIGSGTTPDASQTVQDISNSGYDPTPAGSVATTVRFDLPKGLIGVAKSVGTPTLVSTGVYDIPYTISVSNMGTVALKKVQVVDSLSKTFGNGALIVSNRIPVTASGTVQVDTFYTGQGLLNNLLVDTLSSLAVGAKATLSFTVRVDVSGVNSASLSFDNTAKATAYTPTDDLVTDVSTAGTNDDPDNDLDPRNNNQPTPITLNGLSGSSYLGLALSVRDTVRQSDNSYNVTYQLVLKNYGSEVLKYVTVSDTLSKVFNTQTGASFSVVKTPYSIATGSTLKLNSNYNGVMDAVLVLGDSTSQLGVGKVDTVLFVVNVATNGSTTTYLNTAYGQGVAKSGTVQDISTSGTNPDLNGNGNPTDSNEREATPLNLTPTYTAIFIPEGFSPNGDGINDTFVIRGVAGLTVSLDVYNRWGNLVYQNADYHNDWDGKPNTGIVINSASSNGVPDGTYYYVVQLSDGRKFVRYMTINR